MYKDPQRRSDYLKNWRKEHPEQCKQHNIQSRLRLKEWFAEVKANLFCIKCGENRIPCLDFHHRDPNEKESHIANMVSHASRKRILAKIAKCDVLCANCHRMEHSNIEN